MRSQSTLLQSSSLVLIGLVATLTINNVQGLNNGLGLKPAMGWNTWNAYHCDISKDIIIKNADKIKQLGLDQVGYVYVNIDDCWQLEARDKDGNVQADTTKFPNGMKEVGDYLHTNGLKFGIYSSAGTKTCQGKAGSLGFETADAKYYASIGADYLKYDNCYNNFVPALKRYTDMGDALTKSGRPIYYSICNWGNENVWQWGASVGNSWRTTLDIENNWGSMRYNFVQNSILSQYAAPGGWNDPDMLEVGNNNLTITEQRSHFALWCFVKAPLILGNDLTNMGPEVLAIISNKNLIAVNQDSLGQQATCVMNCKDSLQVYHSYNADNGPYHAVLVINWDAKFSNSLILDFTTLGISSSSFQSCQVTDLWTGSVIGIYRKQYFVSQVFGHDNIALKIQCSGSFSSVKESFLE
eukprot:403333964